jgi:PAS domain-containing protein
MLTKPTGQVGTPSSQLSEASRASAPIASDEVMGLDPRATSSDPRLYQVILDRISHGVTFFDGQQRLILCNRRYAEIYRLAPEDVRPGTTLSEIAERRIAVGTCPMVTEDVRSFLALEQRGRFLCQAQHLGRSAQRRSDNPNGLSAYD